MLIAIPLDPLLKSSTCPLNPLECDGETIQPKKYDDIFDYFDCVRKVRECNEGGPDAIAPVLYQPSTDFSNVSQASLLFAFCSLTSIFHVICALRSSTILMKRYNVLRWWEYAVTSSIMLMMTLGLQKVENLWNHVFVIMLSMTCNLAGGLYDVLAIEAPQLLRSAK